LAFLTADTIAEERILVHLIEQTDKLKFNSARASGGKKGVHLTV